MSYLTTFTKGLIKENPVLVMLLGMCPSLAVTTLTSSGIGMGLATTFVLVGASIVISMTKSIIPAQVRLPAYIVIIAGFVTIVSLLMERYLPALNESLGVFLALIVVNCIILARAEVFANKNTVKASIFDALGMGMGFTLALLVISSIREVLGNGSWYGISLFPESFSPMRFFTTPAGGFFVFGVLVAVINIATNYKMSAKEFGCDKCPNKEMCGSKECAD
jgi:electron transport complex protein RnfE